jgi:hypothetical protein
MMVENKAFCFDLFKKTAILVGFDLTGEMFTPRDEHSLLFRRMEGRTENFTPRG